MNSVFHKGVLSLWVKSMKVGASTQGLEKLQFTTNLFSFFRFRQFFCIVELEVYHEIWTQILPEIEELRRVVSLDLVTILPCHYSKVCFTADYFDINKK